MSTFDYILTKKNFDFINPVTCGYEYCQPFHTPGPRKLDYWTLHFVVSGTGIFQIGDTIYHPKSGDCFVIRPDELCYYKADGKDPWHYVWIGFVSDVPLPKILSESVFSESRLERAFLSLENHYSMKNDVEEFVYGKLFEIMAILHFGNTEVFFSKSCDLIAQKAIAYIEANYMNKITIQQLSNQLHLERTYFSSAFKKSVGISPQEYLNNHRLSRAANLLTTSDCNVTQVAQLIGYNDAFSFSRMFKKHYDVSPKAYQQQNRTLKRSIKNGHNN